MITNNSNHKITSYLDWADQGKADWWRYLLGSILAIFILLMLGVIGMFPLMLAFPNFAESVILSLTGLLLSFVIPFFAIPLLVQLLHRRPYWSVALPQLRFEAWNFWMGFLVYTLVGIVASILLTITGMMPVEANPDFAWGTLIVVALIGFVGIFIQAGAEEILFRGYITQFVRRFTANKYLFLTIPALVFAYPHIANVKALGGGWLAMLPYFVNGLLFGWAAYRSGSLWLALGLHLSNNWTGVVLVGAKGDVLPATAPFVAEVPGLTVGTVIIALQAVVTVLILHYLLTQRERGTQQP